MNVAAAIPGGLPPVLLAAVSAILAGGLVALWSRYRRCRRESDALRREKEVMFGFVHDVAEVFSDDDVIDIVPLLEKVLFYALRTTGGASGAVYLFDAEGATLRARAISGVFPPLLAPMADDFDRAASKSQAVEKAVRTEIVRKGQGPVGRVADLGSSALIGDAERDPELPVHGPAFLKIRSLVAVPMRFRHRVMGVLVAANRIDGQPYSPSDLNLLQALADQASVSLHYVLLREELDAKRRLDHDLVVARRIQQMLLPREVPVTPLAEFAAVNVPAQEVGGDYYDFLQVDEHHVGIAIADVSGKGVSGGLIMSACRSVLRAKAPGCLSPAEVLRSLNRVLSADLGEDMFITALYMILDTRTLELTIARAGHEAPILHRPFGRGVTRIESPGMGIGIGDPEMFERVICDARVSLLPEDVVLLFTDGISEALDDHGAEFGVQRIMETLVLSRGAPASALIGALQSRVHRFTNGHPPHDDLTLVVTRIRPEEREGAGSRARAEA
jgi:sigma-B regulation protein RsbU (phosphoserine phosphatase)